MTIRMKNPSHPGAILRHEFLEPVAMSEGKLARHLGVPRTRIERLTKQVTSMTPDTAARLAKFYSTTPQFWLNMQVNYDLANLDIDVSKIEPMAV